MTGADDRAVRELDRRLGRHGLTLAAFVPEGERVLFAAKGAAGYRVGHYDHAAGFGLFHDRFVIIRGKMKRTGEPFESLSDALAWMDDRKGGLVA